MPGYSCVAAPEIITAELVLAEDLGLDAEDFTELAAELGAEDFAELASECASPQRGSISP